MPESTAGLEGWGMSRVVWVTAFALGAALLSGAQGAVLSRDVECFAVASLGASSEGQRLYLQGMGFGPEALRGFAPSRFSRGSGKFFSHTEGAFGYEANTPVEVARSGSLVLYKVAATVRSAPPPRAAKTITVDISLRGLAGTGDAVQPGIKAIELAAAKAGWRSGLAWVLGMQWRAPDVLRARVALAP